VLGYVGRYRLLLSGFRRHLACFTLS
jgi:hypothetical protein